MFCAVVRVSIGRIYHPPSGLRLFGQRGVFRDGVRAEPGTGQIPYGLRLTLTGLPLKC